MAERFTDGRVPDSGVRALFARQYRWQCWLDVEAALAAAEAECGVIPVAAAEAIASAAQLAGLDVARIQRGIAETSHPLMALVTELAMAAGEHGGWVHWGATTQNITQTGDVLVLREAHRKILRLLAGVLSAAADLTERAAGMLAAGRTHGQHAVPITFGFKPAGWIDEIVRHVTRLRSAEGRVFTAMTGGAVGTFASLGRAGPPVQDAVAARLDLVPMAVPSRAIVDSFAEYVCLLGLLGATGTRIALEVFQLMKTELAEASEPAPTGTVGSSTMPHKRNPQLSDDCITIGAQLRALVPLALEGMLHDHEVDGAHSAMLDDALERACVLAGDLLVRLEVIVSGLEVDPARMRANLSLSGGMISSEAVMLGLGQAIGRQTAHEVVYDAARSESTTFAAALKHDPRVTAHLDAAAIDRLLDPAGHTGLSEGIARSAAQRARSTAHDITAASRPIALIVAFKDAYGRLGEDPFVDSGDAAGRTAPQHPGPLGDRVDGRDDSEAVTGPLEGGTGLERPIQVRRGDLSLPGRPGVDVGVQLPDGAHRCSDVDLVVARTGAPASIPAGTLSVSSSSLTP